MELVSICVCREKVRFDLADEAFICPHCGRWIDLVSGPVDFVDGTFNGENTDYEIGIDGERYRFTSETTDFSVGSVVTIAFCQGKTLGISDESRKLYFPVWEPKPFHLKWLALLLPAAAVFLGGILPAAVAAVIIAPLFLLRDEPDVDLSGWGIE